MIYGYTMDVYDDERRDFLRDHRSAVVGEFATREEADAAARDAVTAKWLAHRGELN